MSTARAYQFIALRNLSRGSHQVRHLHMTGPQTYASPILTKAEHPALNLPRDIAGLRAECKRRNIDPSGAKNDLIARLNANELAHSRAFSTTPEKRPTPEQQSPKSTRHFNTSRTLKAVNDSSTIDFAYLPMEALSADPSSDLQVRVPILPTTTSAPSSLEEPAPPVMKPQISTMSADAVFLPMSELSDGHAMNIDFHAMADRVAYNLRRIQAPVEQQAGIMKQIWSDMVDDMLAGATGGAGKKAA